MLLFTIRLWCQDPENDLQWKDSRLGAVFFFSRVNGFNDHKRVIPTLAYQLAINCVPYKLVLTEQLANDPQLLDKAPPTLFRKLIVDPFLKLQTIYQSIQAPFLVLLDGLDECYGENNQCELLEMIAETARVYNTSIPLRWLIVSRPEEHLKYAFADVQLECGVEELLIDGQCHEDVGRVLRNGFAAIKRKCRSRIPAGWPPMDELKVVERTVDGLFVFCSVVLKDVGNPNHGDPARRLTFLVSFLERVANAGTANPLESLDKFYFCILNDISETDFSTTRHILAHLIFMPDDRGLLEPAQALCNFLHIDQSTFYGALRKLHSVINIPEPEDADKSPLRFFHASFQDFLVDPNRSGLYHIARTKAIAEVIKSALFWNEFDSVHFHSAQGVIRYELDTCQHRPLPNLKWVSAQNEEAISKEIIEYSSPRHRPWKIFNYLTSDMDDFGLLSKIRNLDFRYIRIDSPFVVGCFVAWLYAQVKISPLHLPLAFIDLSVAQACSDGIVRTEPVDEIDQRLLSYLDMILDARLRRPASLSSMKDNWKRSAPDDPVTDNDGAIDEQGSFSDVEHPPQRHKSDTNGEPEARSTWATAPTDDPHGQRSVIGHAGPQSLSAPAVLLSLVPDSSRKHSAPDDQAAGNNGAIDDRGPYSTAERLPKRHKPDTTSQLEISSTRATASTGIRCKQSSAIVDTANGTNDIGLQNLGALEASAFFPQAHNFTVHNPIMVDNSVRNNTQNMISSGKTVLERLIPYIEPRAELYSNARHPPPSCHEGTRTRTRKRLWDCLFDDVRCDLVMKWLRGSAGTGKSAVAQTFAEECSQQTPGRLGAVFFFSRINGFNDHTKVIPTLAYQLAINCPRYKLALTKQLAHDPQLLNKAPPTLFRKLIVDPFLKLQDEKRQSIQTPLLVLLDGLDECHGEHNQCELIEMIAETARVYNTSIPLRWLIVSRPEEHLKYAFADVQLECGVEELLIDGQCREDVGRVLRNGFAAIKRQHRSRIPAGWPPMDELKVVERTVDGLFVFCSVVLKDVGNPNHSDPACRLTLLVSFLKRVANAGTANPLEALDKFYFYILDDISKTDFSTTWRILAHHIFMPRSGDLLKSAQALCNFLHIHQSTFYGALRKLHSVINIPEPEDAGKSPLRFFHASFQDFLVDPNRSGVYHIAQTKAMAEVIKSTLFWHKFDSVHFHSAQGASLHGLPLPNLKWVSARNEEISKEIIEYSSFGDRPWKIFNYLTRDMDDFGLLSKIRNLDFRYIRINSPHTISFFVAWLYAQVKVSPLHVSLAFIDLSVAQARSDGIVRTEPVDEIDQRLLSYLDMILNGHARRPASLPSIQDDWGKAILDLLAPYTEPRAQLYSNARHPPPTCHEGTRTGTRMRLWDWFNGVQRDMGMKPQPISALKAGTGRFNDDVQGDLMMKWLRGSAGTGKSAIAQTFAEECTNKSPNRLGAVFFFSRANGFNDHIKVIPTLAYQLAVNHLPYKLALTEQLANDPQLLDKAPPTLFRKLIVEPLLKLQIKSRQFIHTPFLVLLDGLDECHGESNQCELIELIAEASRVYSTSLPLRWLLVSRPEEHLKYAFADVQLECGLEELLIDGQCREDVHRVLCDGFRAIKKKYRNRTPPGWPPIAEFKVVERTVDGLFVFASTVLKDIGSSDHDNPVLQLTTLVSFLNHVKEIGTTNPLEALDKFYTHILDDVSKAEYSTISRILAHHIHMPPESAYVPSPSSSVQTLCNFLRIDQNTFYGALKKLHSVINIPEPEDADKLPLQFFHASFQGFLVDRNRSGRYHIVEEEVLAEIIKLMLLWHEVDSVHFHSNQGVIRYGRGNCKHGPLPDLKWASAQNEDKISGTIIKYSSFFSHPWGLFYGLTGNNPDNFVLLLQIRNFDFRYITINYPYVIGSFAACLCTQDHSNEVVRAKPRNEIDQCLLLYLDMVLEGYPKRPASLSSIKDDWNRYGDRTPVEYLFLGKGSKTIIIGKGFKYNYAMIALNADKEPSRELIADLKKRLGLLDDEEP
ncbi:hypothetical protein AN958_06860 [Leucoagaricus sp. SymC.cos]|nr:hypothetical protein AN958_06860 [Leucoagaricus sp. SymC.cos]